jgi:hypothetical protein
MGPRSRSVAPVQTSAFPGLIGGRSPAGYVQDLSGWSPGLGRGVVSRTDGNRAMTALRLSRRLLRDQPIVVERHARA